MRAKRVSGSRVQACDGAELLSTTLMEVPGTSPKSVGEKYLR
jgi:hypothetical protein